MNPNGYSGGNGGGSNWTALTTGNFNTKREFQTSHSITGSATKVRGKWVHKAGMEFRNLLSNYADPEQGSVAMPSPFAHQGGNFNFQYVTASGGVASLVTTNAQRGINAAGMLLGTGVWWIRPGANVDPAFSQKYFAIYSQNDWRASSKLTINLGLRWEVQPGPTERFDRMSSSDFDAQSSFDTRAASRFPGLTATVATCGTPPTTTAARASAPPISGTTRRFCPRWLRHHLSADQHRLLLGADRLRLRELLRRRAPAGVRHQPGRRPVIRFSDPAPISPALGGDETNPGVYGIGEARFDRGLENGQARQWNVFVERSFASRWMASIGYSASFSTNLHNRSFPIQNIQIIDPAILADWRNQYIASNGTLNPATQLVQNPWQPATGPLVPFAGMLGQRTIARQNTLFPYPLLVGSNAAVNRSQAKAEYHSMILRVNRRFADGFMLDATYTWSRNRDNSDTVEDNQGFNAGGTAGFGYDITDLEHNMHLGFSDVPHRLIGTFLYELPFGKGKPIGDSNAVVNAIAGGWQLGGSLIWQTGFPIAVSGASTGAALARPDRIDGVPLLLPENLWGWYDGQTPVTLPSGRVITPPNRTYLKYNPDAFGGRVVTTPNGRIVADQFWDGNADITYDEIRTDNRFNIDLSIRRTFSLPQAMSLEVGADAMNILNNTQFSGSYTGGLGGTVTTANPALGLVPGMGNANNYGTRGMATYNPRQVMLRATVRF